MMKVFISHQRADSFIASEIRNEFERLQIETYLDVVDSAILQDGDDLAKYILASLRKCTHLLAVVSSSTKNSWWVPWEIGAASEREYPLATFAHSVASVPEYLEKWPVLTSVRQVVFYVDAMKRGQIRKRAFESAGMPTSRSDEAKEFHKVLKASLG